jgi:geranylgeranyl reductase family protein
MPSSSTYDALVIGAGPAGASAAWALARGGRRVALVDRDPFPRDKTCGDGLIPDALGALDAMGLRAAVAREAASPRALRVYAPNGRSVALRGEFLCLSRLRFDRMVVEAAVTAGAELLEPMTALRPIRRDGVVAGAHFKAEGGEREVRAAVTLLATGANATAARAFGLASPAKPNAVAGRAYFKAPPEMAALYQDLAIVYERSLCPGYGWIFPGPAGYYNVGVGFFSSRRGATPRLHELWARFTTRFAPARELLAASEPVGAFRGAPLRLGLQDATLGRPGLLVLGDAAAMTYPATGEGIGKAMESGLMAGRLVSAQWPRLDTVHAAYDAEFRSAFRERYHAYWVAQAWSSRPWLLNLLAARAIHGRFVRRELEALVAETGNPRRLFSVPGIVRALWQ